MERAGKCMHLLSSVYIYVLTAVSFICIVVVLVTQSYPALCDPMDYSQPHSSVDEILPTRILEWVCMLSLSVVSDSLQPRGLQPTRLLRPLGSPGKNTGVGCHSLLQGLFLTEGSNPVHWHCRQIFYSLSHPRTCP